ncbi:hypothetical protein ACFLZX_03155 [Nanoarchaeota archaeon]
MSSFSLPPNKLKGFVRHLCVAADKIEKEKTGGYQVTHDQMHKDLHELKQNINELEQRRADLYNMSRQGEIILADLRRRVRDVEGKLSRSDEVVHKEFEEEHDKLAFLTQNMDKIKDRINQVTKIHNSDIGKEDRRIEEEDNDIKALKVRMGILEKRFNNIKSSMDSKKAGSIKSRISKVKNKLN